MTGCTSYQMSAEYRISIINCKHILKHSVGESHSVVNPHRWYCDICQTEESVLACLSCPQVSCGSYMSDHALDHFNETGHHLVIDVHDHYVYCYKCKDYVLNDNRSSDIHHLRESLQSISYQSITGTTRSGHTVRSAAISSKEEQKRRQKIRKEQLNRYDRKTHAIWHNRFARQRRAFLKWKNYVKEHERHNNDDGGFSSSDDDDQPLLNLINKKPALLAIQHHPLRDDEAACSEVCETVRQASDSLVANNNDEGVSEYFIDCGSLLAINPQQLAQEEALASLTTTTTTPSTSSLPMVTCTNGNKDFTSIIQPISNNKSQEIVLRRSKRNATTTTAATANRGGASAAKKSKLELNCGGGDGCVAIVEPTRRSKRLKERGNVIRFAINDVFVTTPAILPPPSPPSLPSFRNNHNENTDPALAARVSRDNSRLALTITASSNKKEATKMKKKKETGDKKEKKTKRSRKRHELTSEETKRRRITVSSRYHRRNRYSSNCYLPGVTGLKNLGNTCYLNSIIQVLGHLPKFRQCLGKARSLYRLGSSEKLFPFTTSTSTSSSSDEDKKKNAARSKKSLATFDDRSTLKRSSILKRRQRGLSGGRQSQENENLKADESSRSRPTRILTRSSTGDPPQPSLCHELNDLYHVMWSGKWSIVSPSLFLTSVWKSIPSFRGYSQQDAQEFLCELLDKIVVELKKKQHLYREDLKGNNLPTKSGILASEVSKIVHSVFEGRLHSQVKCLECGFKSVRVDPFWDLSLDFPNRYHTSGKGWRKQLQPCSLLEMLDKFTEAEQLEGGRVYSCTECNKFCNDHQGRASRRQHTRRGNKKFTCAEKQIKILEYPQVLRFHLKRFRWSGRNHREKIATKVDFPSQLNISKHCCVRDGKPVEEEETWYDLTSVVIHHGRGFGSGHYTAYCWNDKGKFWVHCNDSSMELCSIEDVMGSQAYILFYSHRQLAQNNTLTDTQSSSTTCSSSLTTSRT